MSLTLHVKVWTLEFTDTFDPNIEVREFVNLCISRLVPCPRKMFFVHYQGEVLTEGTLASNGVTDGSQIEVN